MATRTDFLPRADQDFRAWSEGFRDLIVASPQSYGITQQTADAYSDLHNQFAVQLQLSVQSSTKSHLNTLAKQGLRKSLERETRRLARVIRGNPAVTADQRVALGLGAPDKTLTPSPVPKVAPAVRLVSTAGRIVRIRLFDEENPERRGKPDGVSAATIFWHVGEHAPSEIARWSLWGNVTRITSIPIKVPTDIPAGSKVWFTAFWQNTRGIAGPAAPAVYTHISESPMLGHAA